MIIQTENLTKFYGDTVGIRDLNLNVKKGEIFGFLGPNGSGKTTTIRLLLDLIHPTRGRVLLFGQEMHQDNLALKERIGYLPGDFRGSTPITGRRFLDYLASFRTRGAACRKELMSRLELSPEVLQRRIKHLSHGNRQKLGIIHALEHDPDLAILDEPTLGLDPLMQEAFYQIIKNFKERGKTIFFSSHNLPEVEKVCQRVAIIREGRLVTLESIETLKKNRVRRMILVFEGRVDPNSIHLPGARLQRISNNECTFLVEGDIKPLLQQVGKLPIADLFFPEPDLEDIFFAYYQKEGHGQE